MLGLAMKGLDAATPERNPSHKTMNTLLTSRIIAWVSLVTRRPVVTLVIIALCAILSGVYASNTLRLEGDVTELVDSDSDFLRNYSAYKEAFPQHRRLNVIVVDGVDARRTRVAEQALLEGIGARRDLFPNVYAPGADPFLMRHALLFLDTAQLTAVVDKLASAQPALATLARDPSLRGLETLFARAVADRSGGVSLAPLADLIGQSAHDVVEGGGELASWGEIVLGAAAPTRRLIVFQGSLGTDDGNRARDQAEFIRTIVTEKALLPANGITVRLTGRGPLSTAELESAISSVQLVGLVSLGFVALLLWLGLGSLRAILAALFTLLTGLVFTAAFAAFFVGSLNVLSLTFAVLFVGLGIDFAIHLILRRLGEGATDHPTPWPIVMRGLGPTISLCGLTTAVAFLSFWPTAFRGLAELGLISAAGMVIAVAVSFTVLPPALDVVQARGGRGRVGFRWAGVGLALGNWARPISLGALVLLGVGAAVGLQVRFDFNSLNLQNPDSETVRTLVSLHDDGTITPYTLTIAAEDLTEADHIAEVLRAMPVVGSVKTLRDFVPPDQDARLAALEEAQILLGPAVMFARPLAPPDDARRLAAVRVLETQARALFAATNDLAFSKLADALGRLLASDQAGPRAKQLEVLVAGDFVETIETLRDALEAERLTIETLPTELVARETGADGQVRVVVLPRDDLRDFAALGEFVRTVQGAFPDATGRPALEAGVGEIVVDAFRQAFATAAVAIFIILLLAFRSVVDAALVMIPLLLAAALTAAAMVVLAIPLNVANVIVLPLLLGMGVDNGLHVVGRFRESASVADVYRTSTPRAVVISALTTLLSFVALAFAEHRGMASMGLLLAIAIGFILLATLVVLPALLAWRAQRV
jgi:hopanoid biosynthesis associated RND transporter like protein HpnN